MQSHGSYENLIVGTTLVSRWIDAWNYETAVQWSHDYLELAKTLSFAPWASLIDLSNWEIGTPDVYPLVSEVSAWCNDNNLQVEVVVCSLTLQKYLAELGAKKMPNVQSFSLLNLNQAKEIFYAQGFMSSHSL